MGKLFIWSSVKKILFPFTAPKPFKPKVRHRKISGTSPFTTNRKYSIPQGKQFTIKKSDKGPTEFKEFKRSDDAWEVCLSSL